MSHTTRLVVSDDKIYAYQLSGTMCESHGCWLKTLISYIKNNFSCKLTNPDKVFFNTLLITKIKLNISKMKTSKKGTQLYHNMLQCKMFIALDSFSNDWKAAENCWECLEIPVMKR